MIYTKTFPFLQFIISYGSAEHSILEESLSVSVHHHKLCRYFLDEF